MSVIRVPQKLLTNTFRSFHRSTIFRESKSAETSSSASKNVEQKKNEDPAIFPGSKGTQESPFGAVTCMPTTLDKYLLVWFKEYKSVADVPYKIREEKMSQIKSKARIRIANILMILILFGCVWAVVSGRKEAKSGNFMLTKYLEKKKIRDEHLAELEKK